MDYNTWMAETRRGVTTPRSAELKAVDNAFRACGNTATGSLRERMALAQKLVAWIEAQARKGSNWKQSTRNATKDASGRGTVERLMRDLTKDPTFKPMLDKYLVAAAPPAAPKSNAYSPGKWDRDKDKDGNWYEFIRQEKGNSCVCATIVMVKRAFHNLSAEQLSEAEIRGLMALEETGMLHQGVSAVSVAAQTQHDWDNIGTGPDRAVAVLKKQPASVPGARKLVGTGGQVLLDALRKCSRKYPGLVGWRWHIGGHFTMCCGPTKDQTQLIIVDPWTGIGYVDNTLAGFTQYQNGAGYLGVAIVCN